MVDESLNYVYSEAPDSFHSFTRVDHSPRVVCFDVWVPISPGHGTSGGKVAVRSAVKHLAQVSAPNEAPALQGVFSPKLVARLRELAADRRIFVAVGSR